MARATSNTVESASRDTWQVVVICEDELTHARALSICERLAGRCCDDLDLRFSWWLFTNLDYTSNAQEAARSAATAQMVFFAAETPGDLPENVKSWIETWICMRSEPGGALVCLTGGEANAPAPVSLKELYLRQVAHRAGMDFLSDLPKNLGPRIPESADWFAARACAMGPVMDGILHQTGRPPQASTL